MSAKCQKRTCTADLLRWDAINPLAPDAHEVGTAARDDEGLKAISAKVAQHRQQPLWPRELFLNHKAAAASGGRCGKVVVVFDAVAKAKMQIRLTMRLVRRISGDQPSFMLGPLRN